MGFFEDEMKKKGIKKITNNKELVKPHKPNISKESILHKRRSAVKSNDTINVGNVKPDDELYFYNTSLTSAEKSELMNKKHCKQSIDLHGKTEEQAINFIEANLQECYKKNCRFLEIVHGRGNKTGEYYPVLKNAVYQRLHNCKYVKGFCSVLLDNGTRNKGAVMVMLEQKKPDKS